ncbi:MAG: hypothetical protein K0S53_400 [Bacteroidetes bacterium]|jgi:hypothetical protein|nr:hypothetical protein [Bacteroidota bacterium]
MPNNVTINLGAGGLGRPLAGEDFISGYIHYTTSLPSGFSTSDRIKQVFSVADAEDLGITDTSIGETKAVGTFTITNIGSNADTLDINVTTQVGTVNLGTYTKASTETGTTAVATAVAVIINAGTSTHGYSASTSTANVSVAAPIGSGVGGNSFLFSNITTGTIATTGTTFAGGVASQIDVMHYHIAEYFRAQPKGVLYVGVYTASTDFNEVVLIQNHANGKIRQLGVYTQAAFNTSAVALLQTQADLNAANYKPLEVIYQADFSAVSDLTSLTDLHTLFGKNISVCLGQDGNATGKSLFLAAGKSIGCVGLTLGAVAFAKVSESIAWVDKFNMSSVEMETLAFANGSLYNVLSDGLINNLDAKGYIFLKKYIGIAGSYFDNPYTCVAVTSDYCRINNNRTINKVSRGLRTFLLPAIASPIKVNADGTLSEDVIASFKAMCNRALDVMIRDGELSAFKITINPAQNVLSTNQLFIDVKIVPVGTSDEIIVNVGYTLAI